MRVTFVYCAIGIAGFNANRLAGDREGSWIGHGVASVAAATQARGHKVDLIDLRQLSGWDDFIARIQASPAEVYGLSVAPVDEYSALQAVYHIKVNMPEAKIIVGGIHPSICPEKYNFDVIDTVVAGEGEVTFPGLIKDLNNLPKFTKGVKPNLDNIPWVDRQLFDYRRELECFFAPGQETPSITMIAGRGCPYSCSYCQPAENAVFGKPYRMRSARDVVAEMLVLKADYDYKSVTFWDDTFTVNRQWCFEFADRYADSGIGAKIAACSRADIICRNEDLVERLAEVGVDWFVIGLESGSQRLLDFIKKGTTVEQNIRASEICRKYGIKIFGTFMLGLPTETREESKQTIEMIHRIRPELASPFWYVPIEGTGLYDFCDQHDLILDKGAGIARTGMFRPTLRGVDYEFLREMMPELAGTY